MAARDPFGKHATVRIVLTYALLSALWIVASDWALEQIVADTQLLSQLQTAKGWGFVLITCTLLYGMIRNSQQSLRANYGLLQNIVEGTTDAVYVKDRRGRYVLVNSVAANILGSPADAVIGLKDRDLIPSEVARRLQATDQQIMAQGELVNLEETVPVGGQQRTYWSTKYIWRSSQGQVQGLIGISRDLTEYKRLQEERQQLIQDLQQQTEDLQALYLITANAISTLSVEELLNVLLERLLSVTAADAAVIFLSQDHSLQVRASRGLSDFQIAFYSSIVGEGFAGTVFQTGAPLYVEDVHSDVRFRGPRHEQRPTRSLLGVPLQRENHRIGVLQLEWHTVQPYQERALHLLEIIAERCTLAILNAQLFEQTQRLKERLQLQIDRMPVGCIIHDQDFRFVDWNRAAETIFGYSKAEVLGKHPSELIVPPSAQLQVNEIFKQLLGGSMTAHSTNENQTKTGRLILCHWHNTPLIDAHGNFQGLLSMVQDITEQRQTEERLKRLAYFDQVTGLPRRSLFLQRLQELIQDQQGSSIVAVLYLDIERFKVIKYSLGHRIAEALLVAIARRLESCLQPPVMISHMESDEFAVLLESIADVSEASRWADIVQAELSRP
ncbi:MAG TPA: PAS domain S-box protein, partial [Trichocoleus sp.]